MVTTSRLGEATSPGRDPGLLKTHKPSPRREIALNMNTFPCYLA